MNRRLVVASAPVPMAAAVLPPPSPKRLGVALMAMRQETAPITPEADWDLLFHAVAERMRLTAGQANITLGGRHIGTAVLECMQALEQLHAGLADQRGRRLSIEGELRLCQADLAHARQQLAGVRKDERRARHLATHDCLTALPNRYGFGARLDMALAPPRAAVAVLYIDLDGFKTINDEHGHGTGDELLRIVAKRLSHALRKQDMVCRMGGDEFACMLVDPMDREQLSHLACKLFDAVAAPLQVGSLELSVRPSIGIAMSPTDGVDPDVLLNCADAAMYQAKRQQLGYAFFSSACVA